MKYQKEIKLHSDMLRDTITDFKKKSKKHFWLGKQSLALKCWVIFTWFMGGVEQYEGHSVDYILITTILMALTLVVIIWQHNVMLEHRQVIERIMVGYSIVSIIALSGLIESTNKSLEVYNDKR